MSPLFPLRQRQPHVEPSPPQAQSSPPLFTPSPHVLNFKQVIEGKKNNGSTEATSYGIVQNAIGQLQEATSSSRRESKKKTVLNEDGVLPVREVQNRLYFGENALERQERVWVNNIETQMNNQRAKVGDHKDYGGWQQQGVGWESRSQRGSKKQRDWEFSSVSSSNQEEFFDTQEEPLDDSTYGKESVQVQRTPNSKPCSSCGLDGNLKSLLNQEIKRRMASEDAMAVLQLQCMGMASHLPSIDEESPYLNGAGGNDLNGDSQRLVVAQVVAYSIARGVARAEVDGEMENVIVKKNREILRLQDKLHYYELVNHEMSQELARTRRLVRQNRNQWLMVCAGSAICMVVSAILVRKFVPWPSSQLRVRGILPSNIMTDTSYHDV